jgi:hypothetical protein
LIRVPIQPGLRCGIYLDYRAILAAAPAAGVEHIFVNQEPLYVQFTALETDKAHLEYL